MIAIVEMTVGTAPADFEFARTGRGGPAQWTVVADATASDGRAIEQISIDSTDYRFPLAIYRLVSAGNVDIAVRFKAVAGKVVRANALEDNVRFYRVIKGVRQQIEGVNIKVTANEWHELGLRAEGERFTIMFDGRQLFTATDGTLAGAGRVALWTKADSVTRFDRIEIRTSP